MLKLESWVLKYLELRFYTCTETFIIMKNLSLSLVMIFFLEVYFAISMAAIAFFG